MFRALAKDDPRLAAMYDEEPILLFADPPLHTRLRSLVSRAFTPSRVAGLCSRAEELTRTLVDRLAEEGSDGSAVDLIDGLAYPLPITIISDLMGVPEADREAFRAWSTPLAKSIDPAVLRTPEIEAAIQRAEAETDAYVAALLDERRRRPGDDLISALSTAADGDDMLTSHEIVDLCKLLIIAGTRRPSG